MFRHLFMLLATLLVCSGIIRAHQVDTVEFEFQRLNEYWRLQGEMDIAYMLPETRWVPDAGALEREEVMKASSGELERIRRETEKTLRKHLKLTHAGKPLQWGIEFPDFKSKPFKLPPDLGGFALLTVNLVVKQQSQPGDFVVHWSTNEKALLIILDPLSNDGVPVSVEPGNSLTLLKVSKAAGNKQGKMTKGSQVSDPEQLITERVGNSVAMSWLKSGFLHVAPKGLDHMLFILGLFLAVLAFKPMLWQSLLFTLAHSITLGVCAMGWLPQWSWVEIFIAFSIAFIGIENLFKVKVGKRRYITVFVFGLIHGLGFASVFIEQVSSVPKEKLLQPLLWFNIGVEVAQISVILAAAMLMALIKKKKSKDRAQMIGSVTVTLAGLIWLTQRIFNIDISFGLL